jgi:hypothetical protein
VTGEVCLDLDGIWCFVCVRGWRMEWLALRIAMREGFLVRYQSRISYFIWSPFLECVVLRGGEQVCIRHLWRCEFCPLCHWKCANVLTRETKSPWKRKARNQNQHQICITDHSYHKLQYCIAKALHFHPSTFHFLNPRGYAAIQVDIAVYFRSTYFVPI